jgi:uncharacterized membrane protein
LDQALFEWILLLTRWLHITVAVTWIGTSIFFMWLDRTLQVNAETAATKEGHLGELWMVHGGGFYHVEKMLMGPTKVPEYLHWFKWESYWTWMSGFALMVLIFYTGDGTFLLDASVSSITYGQGVVIGLFALLGSWFFYDFLWERDFTKTTPLLGHALTLAWFVGMDYFLCHTLSGRAAYMHVGGMLGTWMTANVFIRIIPRQLKMVEASRQGIPVNQVWGKNAKNRSTHNTYLTLPVIFIMLSNHFPGTYGHEYNWLILLGMSAAGASIREFFVVRLDKPTRAKAFLSLGIVIIASVISLSKGNSIQPEMHSEVLKKVETIKTNVAQAVVVTAPTNTSTSTVSGVISFEGTPPVGKKLNLPGGCSTGSHDVYSNEVIVNAGKLQNVLVHITKGLEGKTFSDVPNETVELNQKNCQYNPRVIAVRVNQKVDFINSDPVFHNIRSVTTNNKSFNLPMPKKDQRITMTFDKPEIVMQSKCSIHPWMGASIAIMDNPYFSLSNAQGEFSIPKLPTGKYTMEVWHEVLGTQTKEFVVTDSNPIKLDFKFGPKGNSL